MIEKSRAPRKVAIAEHLWEVFEAMGQEMGSDREALINQAMFMFARLNGFLNAGAIAGDVQPSASVAPRMAPVPEPDGEPEPDAEPPEPEALEPAPPADSAIDFEGEDTPVPAAVPGRSRGSRPPPPPPEAAAAGQPDDTRRREVENRVLETAAQLERQIKGRAGPLPEPPLDPDLDPDSGLIDDGVIDDSEIDDDEIVDELMGDIPKKTLYLMAEDGELDKVAVERFLIGRGKHCSFIIQSGKVSREHAVITKEGDEYFIEDLGSSNGTWYQKKRIKKRKIEDGDEYYVCSEKLKCVLR